MLVRYLHGDCFVELPRIDAEAAEAFVCDPPYGIKFQSRTWDDPRQLTKMRKIRPGAAYQLWCERWMTECHRVLRPGGALACFGAARMVHRVAAAMRASEFKEPTVLAWCYQTGVPMSQNVEKLLAKRIGDGAKQFSGYGTALKPAWEAIVVGRKAGPCPLPR